MFRMCPGCKWSRRLSTLRRTACHVQQASPTDEQPLRSLEDRFKSVKDAAEDNGSTPTRYPRIPKVPQILRDTKDFKKLFEPRVVSVGPYHHHKPELQRFRELKLRLTKDFFTESSDEIEDIYRKIASDISELRKCYSEKATRGYNDEDLAWMMLTDGCSLLQFINCYLQPDEKSKKYPIAFVQQDLFLLENQLPFRVLELLMESSTHKDSSFEPPRRNKDSWMEMIERFIYMSIHHSNPPEGIKYPEATADHLLDLLRKRLLGEVKEPSSHNFLDFQRNLNKAAGGLNRGDPRRGWDSHRNVKELKESGILFRRSETNSWRDISFNPGLFLGFLKLPPITIDDSTKSRFFNLVAYEMCPDGPKDSGVTSYVRFLDSLIDKPEDVGELRRKRILRNLLGSDEQVATLFNEIATDLVPDSEAYEEVKRKIQNHCDNKLKTWLAEAWFTHFSSPWTIMAFLGAVLALFLAGVQTYLDLHPPGC